MQGKNPEMETRLIKVVTCQLKFVVYLLRLLGTVAILADVIAVALPRVVRRNIWVVLNHYVVVLTVNNITIF